MAEPSKFFQSQIPSAETRAQPKTANALQSALIRPEEFSAWRPSIPSAAQTYPQHQRSAPLIFCNSADTCLESEPSQGNGLKSNTCEPDFSSHLVPDSRKIVLIQDMTTHWVGESKLVKFP